MTQPGPEKLKTWSFRRDTGRGERLLRHNGKNRAQHKIPRQYSSSCTCDLTTGGATMGQMGLPWMGAQSSSNSILSWAHEAWALDPQPLPRASIHLHSDFRCLLLSLCSRVWPASVVTVDSPSVLGDSLGGTLSCHPRGPLDSICQQRPTPPLPAPDVTLSSEQRIFRSFSPGGAKREGDFEAPHSWKYTPLEGRGSEGHQGPPWEREAGRGVRRHGSQGPRVRKPINRSHL